MNVFIHLFDKKWTLNIMLQDELQTRNRDVTYFIILVDDIQAYSSQDIYVVIKGIVCFQSTKDRVFFFDISVSKMLEVQKYSNNFLKTRNWRIWSKEKRNPV